MKGFNWMDPTKEPSDIVVLLAIIGWVVMMVYVINMVFDWLERLL